MTGCLVIIGGHEDRVGERVILREVARHLGGAPLLLVTFASKEPAKYVDIYREAFGDLGVDITAPTLAQLLDDPSPIAAAGGVFLSGGDQNRLVEAIRGTGVERALLKAREGGAVIAGTSAGASAMSGTMLSRGPSDESPVKADIELAPGLGLLPGVLVDQHFAERGRIGRLIVALAGDTDSLAIGIDEDTAVVVRDRRFEVIGAGAVYVLDAAGSTATTGFALHLLQSGDAFDLDERAAILGA